MVELNCVTVTLALTTVFIVYLSISETRCPQCHQWFAVYAADKKPRVFVYKCRKCDYQWTQESRKLTPLGLLFEGAIKIPFLKSFVILLLGGTGTAKSFGRFPRMWLIFSQAAAALFLIPWFTLASYILANGIRLQMFAEGLASYDFRLAIVMLYPLWAIPLAIGSWIFYQSQDIAAAVIMSSIPLVGAILLFLF